MFRKGSFLVLFPLAALVMQPAFMALSQAGARQPEPEPGQTPASSPAKGSVPPSAGPPPPSPEAARYQAEVVRQKDLPNFHQVHPFLFRSGEPTERGLAKAKEKGIRTLIDLRGAGEQTKSEQQAADRLALKYINLPMSSEPPTKKQVDVFLRTVKMAAKAPDGGAVLVHCAHGSDRTGCLVGIWRVTQDQWTFDEAYKEMRKYWFTPKFTKLSGAVRQYARSKNGSSPLESSNSAD